MFQELFSECCMRIDISELLRLVELLDRDELGVRIFQLSLEVCQSVIMDAPNIKTKFSFYRMNASGSSTLCANPYVMQNSTFNQIMSWDSFIPQKPDGLFALTVVDDSLKGAVDVIIQYESDGYAKKNQEYLQILRKLYQGINLQQTQKDAITKAYFEANGCYAIRSNLENILIDPSQEHYLVKWLNDFTRSHILNVLIILDDMINPESSCLRKKAEKKKRVPIYDHVFFVGAFAVNFLPETSKCNLPAIHPKIDNWSDSFYYMKANLNTKMQNSLNDNVKSNSTTDYGFLFGPNLPWPKMSDVNNRRFEWNRNQVQNYELRTFSNAWLKDEVEIHSVSIERCYFDNDLNCLCGLITPKDVKFHLERGTDLFRSFEVKTINQQYCAFLSLMAHAEYAMLRMANIEINDSTLKLETIHGISWKGTGLGKICIPASGIKNKYLGLGQLKMELRNKQSKYRHRNAFSLSDLFKDSQSLQGFAIRSLERTLPALDDSINSYLSQFNIPNATLFCRMLRIPNILALREMARRTNDEQIADQYKLLLQTLPLGTQTELLFLFDKLRVEMDVVLDRDSYTAKSKIPAKPNLLTLFTIINDQLELNLSEKQLLRIILDHDESIIAEDDMLYSTLMEKIKI